MSWQKKTENQTIRNRYHNTDIIGILHDLNYGLSSRQQKNSSEESGTRIHWGRSPAHKKEEKTMMQKFEKFLEALYFEYAHLD